MARWHRRYLVGVLTAACLAMSLVATGATSATAATTYGAGGGAYATSALKPTMSLVATGATSATAATTYGAGGGAYATPSALKPPAGCPYGDVCFYYAGNGGSLCGYTNADSYNLGSGPGGLAPFGNDCSNIGEQTGSGTIFNNGAPCSGCQDVRLYYNKGYTGASYCLRMDSWLLQTDQNFFPDNETSAGEGAPLAYETDPAPAEGPGGVASAKWTSC